MTITARIVKAVVTLPVLGTVSRNEYGDVVKSGERYRVHVYAANPGWKDERPAPDFLVVGVMTGGGFTSEPTKRSQHVLVPEGRELVALMIDSDGAPMSFESLPIKLVALPAEYDQFKINNGQVFINDALIDGPATYHLNCGVKEKTHEEKLRDDVAALVTEQIKRMLQPGGLLHGR